MFSHTNLSRLQPRTAVSVIFTIFVFTVFTFDISQAQPSANSGAGPNPFAGTVMLPGKIDFGRGTGPAQRGAQAPPNSSRGALDLSVPNASFFERHPISIGVEASASYQRKGLSTYNKKIQLNAQITENIKLVLTGALHEFFAMRENRSVVTSRDWAAFMSEAYVSIDLNEKGIPVVMIVGKQEIPIGIFENRLPSDHALLDKEFSEYGSVIGFSMQLAPKSLALIDSAIISVFETGEDDMSIRGGVGTSVTISKSIFDQRLKIVASGTVIQHKTTYTSEDLGIDMSSNLFETRSSIGLVYSNKNDPREIMVYGQVMFLHNYQEAPQARVLYTLGGSMRVGKGTVAIVANHLDRVKTEVAVGYTYPVTNWLGIGPQITWTRCNNDSIENCRNGWSPMIVARIQYGVEESDRRPRHKCNAIGDPDCVPLGQVQPQQPSQRYTNVQPSEAASFPRSRRFSYRSFR